MTALAARAAFAPVYPAAPKPWTGQPPLWRRMLQLRRDALVTWGPLAYEGWLFKAPFLGKTSFLLNHPDAIRRVLVDNAANYGRTPATRRILHPMIGDGLFLAEGERWKFQRRTSAPAFAPRALDVVARSAASRTAALLARLTAEAAPRVDLLRTVQRVTLEVAGEALFSQTLAPFAQDLRAALDGYGRNLARPSPLDFLLGPDTPTPALLLRRRAGATFKAVIERIIAARRVQAPREGGHDLFDMMTEARDPETGQGFDDAELRDQVATLVIAGHETTALTLFWALYLLALSPEVQAGVAAEAAGLDLSPEGASQAVAKLALTKAVLQETLRLYPAAFTVVRQAIEPDRVQDQDVPAGALMVISPFVLHRHRGLWADPLRFDPGRFLPGATPPGRFAYLPFGIGPRICIGAQFALTEAAIVLAGLVRAFTIDIPAGRRVRPIAVVTVYPERAPAFRLRLRG